ncbi:adhesive plaque matrix protein-like [Amphibalanus amphitrite]|uniref:adhesive plaque matrix protein-like n=1 Tax=Amphibalanus amphitrite TaxID=1232801 RepID=UPI001C9293EC|nr:adhesive plaque matrix protein-like [Amphibalanus amphitrite]
MKFFVVAALLAVAAADSAPSYAPRPAYHPQPAYKPAPYHQDSYDQPPKYDYSYDVHGYGDYEPVFNAQEARDGYATQGSYSVVLPDGRTQTVTYRVDDAYSGTIADVTYEGEARYDEYKPSYKPSYPQPSYKPTYKPAYGN